MDTNVNEEVDMDLLVKDNPDPIEDYKDETNKEVVDQDPDPDQVVKADLEMDPAAATESFIRKHFGLSVEELEDEADAKDEAAADAIAAAEETPETTEDELLGIEPAADETVVTVTPPAGGDTVVTEDGGVPVEAADVSTDVVAEAPAPVATAEEVAAAVEPDSSADVSSLENLRAIFSREDDDVDAGADGGDEPDVSLNVETPNNNVDIDLDDKAVTIEPVEEGGDEDAGEASEDVPTPETDEGGEDNGEEESGEGEESGSEEGGESSGEEEEGSAESWWMI